MRIFLVLALILSLLVTIFAVQNNASIEISFLRWNVTGSLALVLMLTLVLGIMVGVMIMLPGSVRARLAARDERKRKQGLEVQLEMSKASRTAELQAADLSEGEAHSDPSAAGDGDVG
ncbi:MAG: lipopolysaccharide assembly LapA domain-containing protein [Anaerolineales bacterium]|jgi:putative membrane protein